MVDQHNFDVLLTDAVMPGMSGADLIDRLRMTHPSLPLVLMSGYAPGIDGSHEGTTVQLRKPFTARELLAVLEDVLATPEVAASP
jgi:two-component system cell cycle sensor histidine kinase/response regulator CckA